MVLTPRRRRQVCGDNSAGDGDKKARSPGRARRKPLKPLRRECRVNLAGPAVTMLVCFFISHARLWVRLAPGIPCALCFRGAMADARPGRESVAGMRNCIQPTSPGLTGRSSIPETLTIEPTGRGVLDTRCAGYDGPTTASLPATNARRLRKGAKATKQSRLRIRGYRPWIASLALAMNTQNHRIGLDAPSEIG